MKAMFTAILFLLYISSNNGKYTYKCASALKLDTCYLKESVTSNGETTTTYFVESCSKGKTCIKIESDELASKCEKRQFLLKEGKKCEVGSECLSGNCVDNKCAFTQDGSSCKEDRECLFSSFCKISV